MLYRFYIIRRYLRIQICDFANPKKRRKRNNDIGWKTPKPIMLFLMEMSFPVSVELECIWLVFM